MKDLASKAARKTPSKGLRKELAKKLVVKKSIVKTKLGRYKYKPGSKLPAIYYILFLELYNRYTTRS